jgi:proline racemase
MAVSIENVNGDNTIYHQQPDVQINCTGAGAVEGIVKYGGITQSGVDWADGLVTIAEADATDPLVIGNWYDMEIWRPI